MQTTIKDSDMSGLYVYIKMVQSLKELRFDRIISSEFVALTVLYYPVNFMTGPDD